MQYRQKCPGRYENLCNLALPSLRLPSLSSLTVSVPQPCSAAFNPLKNPTFSHTLSRRLRGLFPLPTCKILPFLLIPPDDTSGLHHLLQDLPLSSHN